MSSIDERAPLAPSTDQVLDDLHATLLRAERLWADLAALLAGGPSGDTADPADGGGVTHPGVCAGRGDLNGAEACTGYEPPASDPLAAFRLMDGTVCYRTVPVAEVESGQWFERQHGDETWYQVEAVVHGESAVGLAHDGSGLTWFPRVDGRVRVACTPAESVACQGGIREAAGR